MKEKKKKRVGLHVKGAANAAIAGAIETLYNVIGDSAAFGKLLKL